MMFPDSSNRPRWSPDGSRIVFIDQLFTYLLDLTSGTVTPRGGVIVILLLFG